MRGRQRLLVSIRKLFRQWLQRSRITPIMSLGFARTILGSRPTQAKSLSLGEYVFSPTLHSCLCFHFVSRCLHFATLLSMLVSFRFLVFLFCVLLRKPKKIFLSSFACWELSRVNSFLFLWVKVEDIGYNVQWFLHAYLFSFQRAILLCLLLCVCLQIQLSPMHEHSYYCSHHSIVQMKGNNDDI